MQNAGAPGAVVHGDPRLVELLDVGNCPGSGDLAGVQILDEETAIQVGPGRAIVEVAGAGCIDLHTVSNHLEDEELDRTDTTELQTRIGGILVRADQAGLGVDLSDVGQPFGGGRVLAGQGLTQVLGDQEENHVASVGGQAEHGGVLLRGGVGAYDTHIEDDQVEATGDIPDLGGHRGDELLVGNVDRDRVGGTSAAELSCLYCDVLTAQVNDVHRASNVRRTTHDLRTESLGSTRHKGDTAVDGALTHGSDANLESLPTGAHDDEGLRLLQGIGAYLGKWAIEGDDRFRRAGDHDDRASEGL